MCYVPLQHTSSSHRHRASAHSITTLQAVKERGVVEAQTGASDGFRWTSGLHVRTNSYHMGHDLSAVHCRLVHICYDGTVTASLSHGHLMVLLVLPFTQRYSDVWHTITSVSIFCCMRGALDCFQDFAQWPLCHKDQLLRQSVHYKLDHLYPDRDVPRISLSVVVIRRFKIRPSVSVRSAACHMLTPQTFGLRYTLIYIIVRPNLLGSINLEIQTRSCWPGLDGMSRDRE